MDRDLEKFFCIISFLLGGVTSGDNDAYIATNVTTVARCPSVCVSVTLVHPAKAVRWNEMPTLGRNISVVPSSIYLFIYLLYHTLIKHKK